MTIEERDQLITLYREEDFQKLENTNLWRNMVIQCSVVEVQIDRVRIL